jgi:hypothetical protein
MSLTCTFIFLLQQVSATHGPSSGNTFVTGETIALYTLSSVLLGTSLFLLIVSFVENFHCIFFFAAISVLYVVYFVAAPKLAQSKRHKN